LRVLLTGATGFLGGKLCDQLSVDGHSVVALSRNAGSAGAKLPRADKIYSWDPLSTTPPSEAIQGCDAVVNLVGESVVGLWTASKKRSMRESRVRSTANLVRAMAEAPSGPRVLVSASAVGYYGERGEDEVTEREGPGADFLSKLCVDWEAEARRAGEHGARVVTLRIGLVLGLEGGMLPALLPAARLGLFGRLGSGKQWWPWVHADDVVGLVRFALANEIEGPINATAPNPVRQKDFAGTLGRILGRPSFLFVPSFVLSLAGGLSGETLRSQRAVPRAALCAGYDFLHPDLANTLSRLLGRG
jgi:uncharacterized protein (TIGR01777 family)